MQRSQRQRIREIAQRLAEGTTSDESARQLRKLLEGLAQDSDFESLSEISLFIREQLQAGSPEDRPSRTASETTISKSLLGFWARNTVAQRAVMIAGSSLVLLILVLLLARLFFFSAGSGGAPPTTSVQTAPDQTSTAVVVKPEVSTQPARLAATPSRQPEPSETPPSRLTTTERSLPTPPVQEYVIHACVKWQADQEVGLPGSIITWQTDSDVSREQEILIPNEDGCVEFPVSVSPQTRITLAARPPGDGSSLQIAGYTGSTDDQPTVWDEVEDEESFAIATSLGEENSTEYTAQFLVVARRTFSGQVLSQEGTGIPGADVHLWGRHSPEAEWEPIDKTATADPDGAFVLTDASGWPLVFYRVGVDNIVTNRYVFTSTSASGPDAAWVAGQDPHTSSVTWLETQTALGPEGLSVQDILFNQELKYAVLDVDEALLEPEGLDWQTIYAASDQEEMASRLITIDQSNVDRLQARWEDVELPPGAYALEIWTPENSSARVSYQVLSSDRLLGERTSYQSTRQDKGEINQWIDFSKTLNPSLVIQSPAAGRVSVIVEPSLSTDNREYNLGGKTVFGVGPLRFVKQ